MDPIYGRCWTRLTQTNDLPVTPLPRLGSFFHSLFLTQNNGSCLNASFWLSPPPQVYVLKGLLFQDEQAQSLPTLNSRRPVLTLLKENITFNPVFNTTFNHFFSLSRSRETKQKRDSYKIISSQQKTLLFTPRDFSRSPSPFSPLESLYNPNLIPSNLNLPPVQQRHIGDLFPRFFKHSLLNHSFWTTAYSPFKTTPGLKTKPASRPLLGDGDDHSFNHLAKHHREPLAKGVAYLPQNQSTMLKSQSLWNRLLKINFDSLAHKPFNSQPPLWLPAKVYNQAQSIFTDKMVNTPKRHDATINTSTTPPNHLLQQMKKVIQNASGDYHPPHLLPQKEFQAATRDQVKMMTHITHRLKDINSKIDTLHTQQSMTKSRMQTNPHAKDGGFYDY